ncbi:unnamed protein product [Coffea canephora]|uniref:Uncharacterized protein n=1 Tax=Coffea canephora TaxID=49390 RepID=A0A068UG86_COFCA|nr:unnamed protein product [Coffea canephora]
MASARLFRMSRPLGLPCYPSSSSSNNSKFSSMVSTRSVKATCLGSSGGLSTENWLSTGPPSGHGERAPKEVKVSVSSSGCLVTSKPKTDMWVDLAQFLTDVAQFVVLQLRRLDFFNKRTPWKLHMQMFLEKVIMDCRFFAMFAVGGSLLGSGLCFVEGFSLILESYLQYFHSLSQGSEQEHLVHLLIEAIDMFLVAITMLLFGMEMHVMFVGSSSLAGKLSRFLHLSTSTKAVPSRVGIHTIMQAKSKIGQAVIMMLQVGVLEKFKTIPLVTGFDLACFAGAVFTSSACMLLLSKLAGSGSGALKR